MKKYIIITVSIMFVMSFFLISCAVPAEAEQAAAVEETTAAATETAAEEPAETELDLANVQIGVTLPELIMPFFADLREGLESEAEEQGIGNLVVSDGQNDVAKQHSQVEDFIAQGFDLVIISPEDAEALVSAAEACDDAGIPVFTLDRLLNTTYGPDGLLVTHVGASAEKIGELGMQTVVDMLVEKYGEPKGKVIYLEGYPGLSTAQDRTKGVMTILKKYPNVEIVAQQPAQIADEGLEVTENLMQKYPDVDAIFCFAGSAGVGALRALEILGITEPFIVGCGGTEEQFELIKAGTQFVSTSDYNPVQTGRNAIMVAVKILKGEPITEDLTFVPAVPVTIENVDDFLGR